MQFNLVFKTGKVTLNGKTIKVVPSKNKKYPSTKGWFIFTYKTWTYYIRKTKLGFTTFRMNKQGKIVKGTGGKNTEKFHVHLPFSFLLAEFVIVEYPPLIILIPAVCATDGGY